MKLTPSTMADVVIAWFERFELTELGHEEPTIPGDSVVLEIVQRAEQARRRGDWTTALRDCHLALSAASDLQGEERGTEITPEDRVMYKEAVVHLYHGMVLLTMSAALQGGATKYLDNALGLCRRSVEGFRESKRHCAESVAWSAVGMINARLGAWHDAINACQKGIAIIDSMNPQSSSLKELRRQIVQTVYMMLDSYEQKQSLLA